MVTIPATGKRARSTEDIDKTISNHRRLQRHCDSTPPDAFVEHSNPVSQLIYSGRDSFGAPVVITTSFTGDGKHTRWLYPIEQPLSPHPCCLSDIEADDEESTDSDDASNDIVIPPLKSLKRSRDSDDDEDYVALRTRSRLRASASHSSLASSSTLSTFSELSTNSSTDSVQYPRVSFFRDSRAPSPSLRLRLVRPNVSFKKEDAF
ncbi:hypothetical protein H0H93_016524 [Arthromyces matolae]|nr:hypothetical protein H0H93_016524 [Arthromyces matolae]